MSNPWNEIEALVAERTADLREANRALRQQLEEYERRQETLELHQSRLSRMLDIAVDAIIALDHDQNIFFFNQGAERIFGYTAGEVMGQPLSMLMPTRFQEAHFHHVAEFSERPQVTRHMHERDTIWGLRKDGTEFPAEASISKLEQNGVWTFTVILRDITQRRQMERDLRRALAEARELGDLRSRFIAMLSHELRTPLAVILSSSQVLENYSQRMSEQKKREYHDNIKQQVQHLTELLEDTLAISRAETVGLDFHPEPGDLTAFCRGIAEKMELAAERTHEIAFDCLDSCHETQFDEYLLRLVLNNLLSNAVKYSPHGGLISLALVCADGQATIRITDQGIGIPADDQARLFEIFHRGANVGAIPGTGLGLAIAKQAVKAHQGGITFRSQEGAGTTFTVTIPTH